MRPARAFPCRRRNGLHAAYVNAALTIMGLTGAQRAQDILVEQGVPHPVIVRILHLNGFRRRRENPLLVPARSAIQAGASM